MKNLVPPIIFTILVLSLGCSPAQKEPLPVSEGDLVKLLLDIHVAEGALAQHPGGPSKDSLADTYYNQVAKIHHISRSELDSSLAILQRNPDIAKEVYEKVLEVIEKKRLER